MCLQRSGPSLASRGGGGRLDAHTCLALRSLAPRASRRLSTPAVVWREPYRLLAAPVEPDVLWKHHFHAAPQLITGPWPFVTSDKIMCASTVESEQRETFVWFPITPSVGLCLMSDGHAGQILGSVVEVNRQSKRVSFAKSPEARWLRCQAPSPAATPGDRSIRETNRARKPQVQSRQRGRKVKGWVLRRSKGRMGTVD